MVIRNTNIQLASNSARIRASWMIAFAVLVFIAASFAIYLNQLRQVEATPALRGEIAARKLGCFACHGTEGRGGVADPGSRSGLIPGWDGPSVATYALNEAEVVQWILDAKPARLKDVDIKAGRKPLLPMPAYRGKISDQELADLMGYFRAVSAFDTNITA